MRRWDQHDERRVEQRESLVEVLATGRELAASREAVMMVAGMSSNTVEFGNSSVVDAHGPLVKPHHRALLTARLLVRDPLVLAHVTRMSLVAEKLPEQLPPLLDNAK